MSPISRGVCPLGFIFFPQVNLRANALTCKCGQGLKKSFQLATSELPCASVPRRVGCETIQMQMCSACILIFSVLHKDSFWNKGQANSEMAYSICFHTLDGPQETDFIYTSWGVAVSPQSANLVPPPSAVDEDNKVYQQSTAIKNIEAETDTT